MNAGRELDALVAEKVMGLCMHDCQFSGQDWISDRASCEKCGEEIVIGASTYDYAMSQGVAPHFSTDIAAAWQVVEKLKDEGYWVRINITPDNYYCNLTKDRIVAEWESVVSSLGEIPLAICLAALKAKGIEA